MKAVVFHDIADIRLDEVPDPMLQETTDAIIPSVKLTANDLRQPGWLKVKLEPAGAPAMQATR